MVLRLKFMGKLIALDKNLIIGQNKGPVWIHGPQSLKRLITSSICLSNEQRVPWAGEEALALTGDKTQPTVT